MIEIYLSQDCCDVTDEFLIEAYCFLEFLFDLSQTFLATVLGSRWIYFPGLPLLPFPSTNYVPAAISSSKGKVF
jgi:hypothetical protein